MPEVEEAPSDPVLEVEEAPSDPVLEVEEAPELDFEFDEAQKFEEMIRQFKKEDAERHSTEWSSAEDVELEELIAHTQSQPC